MLSQSEFEERIPHGVVLWAHLQLLNAAYRQNGSGIDDKDPTKQTSLPSGRCFKLTSLRIAWYYNVESILDES